MDKQGPEQVQQQYNITEMMDEDPELQKLHEERIAQLKSEREKRSAMAQQGHGEVTEITEGEFLDAVTKSELVVCHFFHRDFERCKIMDKHLQVLAKKHFKTRFIKLSAPVSRRKAPRMHARGVDACTHASVAQRVLRASGRGASCTGV